MNENIKYLNLQEDVLEDTEQNINPKNIIDIVKTLRNSLYLNSFIDASKITDEELVEWYNKIKLYAHQKKKLGIEVEDERKD